MTGYDSLTYLPVRRVTVDDLSLGAWKVQLSIYIQDPTHTGTTHLYEPILEAAEKASHLRGLCAFATRDGVDHLIEDKVVCNFLNAGGAIDLVVGVDAAMNQVVLE